MLKEQNFKRTKYSCYFTYISMSSIFGLPPLLFMTFREMYGISYTLLGTLVLVNFLTQMSIDLVFTFFSKHFNIRKTIITMPLITSLGLIIYALIPALFPQYAYLGLIIGTFIFSVAAGLSEVLLSPLIASLPSDTPERDMSTLHSLYAYGLLSIILVSSLYFVIFGSHNWVYLTLFFASLPIISFVMFFVSPMPEINLSNPEAKGKKKGRGVIMALLFVCIFLGASAEISMTNWISGYIESALGISKTTGDILGMASFAILLGIGRTAYAKYGKNIHRTLTLGMAGAAVCYLLCALSPNRIISVLACMLTGLFTSMLWPGTLILMEEKIPNPGVAAYALMATGGDAGGSIAPQLLGVIIDKVSVSNWAGEMSRALNIGVEQIGMKTGMVVASVFPILGVMLLLYMKKSFKERKL